MLGFLDIPVINVLWTALVLCWIIINIFWCTQMQKALLLVAPNSKMNPQYVWMVYIPIFGLAWQFLVVNAVAESLGEEYQRRSIISREPKPGYSSGLTANILFSCAIIPAFGIAVALVSFITRIIHLNKIKNYCKELELIMQTQMQYPPQVSQIPFEIQNEINNAQNEELEKNNPNRFMPPRTPEEDYERWRKKD